MNVVLDTNVLVSALWTPHGNAQRILDMIGIDVRPCYDYRVIAEYEDVLHRPKFMFSKRDINAVMNRIKAKGISVIAKESNHIFKDEPDRAFYEVAVSGGAYLITGNGKHFPNEPFIMPQGQFLDLYASGDL
jgi:putative PIN family toxin of toxin-antitoxin system